MVGGLPVLCVAHIFQNPDTLATLQQTPPLAPRDVDMLMVGTVALEKVFFLRVLLGH